MKNVVLTSLVATVFCSMNAHAHFQLALPEGSLTLSKRGQIDIAMPFSHPSVSGAMMAMETPVLFSLTHKGETTDLTDQLESIEWSSKENTAIAYQAEITAKRLGDYVLALEPAPYYEKDEDLYIQQITKTVLNIGGLPTDWSDTIGLKTEIQAHNNPYALYVGSTFSGTVLSNGKPVPHAEIEIEFLNYPVEIAKKRFAETPLIEAPIAALETISMRADADGDFTFGIPKAGIWGIAALGVGPETTYKGKELSQDAVIWIEAYDIKKH